MIRHIVMWKFRDFANGSSGAENVRKIKAMLEALPAKIPQIRSLEVGLGLSMTPNDFDAVLTAEFDSLADLETYTNHPEHVKVSSFVKEVREARAVVDYEV